MPYKNKKKRAQYMREYRQREREILQKARKEFGMSTKVKKMQKKKRKRK